jgi:hypothetical protein
MIIDDPQYAYMLVITASRSAFEFEKIQRLDPRQDRRREHRSGGDQRRSMFDAIDSACVEPFVNAFIAAACDR